MSNSEERPRKTNRPPWSSLSPPSLFSLPLDIVLTVLARVPKRYYPILCCVSKKLRSLVRSPEILKTRSLLGRDFLYICFIEEPKRLKTCHWFSLRRTENNTTKNVFVSIDFPLLPEPCRYSSSVLAVGTEIFFIPGSCIPSSSFWICDTQSGNVREGPRMLVKRLYNTVGLVGSKIYVIGGYRGKEIQAEVFDLKTQTWKAASTPEKTEFSTWITPAKVSLDRKVCALSSYDGDMTCYDTRDGSCERTELPNDKWWRTGKCVIDNVLYIHFSRFGLMWYDTELMIWRVVYGFDLDKAGCVGMAEYYGKMAFLWEKPSLVDNESKEIWCKMIGLLRSDVGIHGTAEPSQLLKIVPSSFSSYHCLSLG
ncbi:hypothetical protein CARUB_v10025632mg [Capsella rubella]|uniref:F-box domain-containing protein n=1 Tax=Capsella rubella TaxID=81985 RepID=R0G1R1_9BRAS|nr:F-box/kelch-repeat protein At2g44630 [Capsella rubella]EOA29347.1 hypothetical protein CARUB_v10025632mg [Capsella rubella]